MKISSTDVLIKSYLDVRLQSLKVIILTYISPPKAAWAGGPVDTVYDGQIILLKHV